MFLHDASTNRLLPCSKLVCFLGACFSESLTLFRGRGLSHPRLSPFLLLPRGLGWQMSVGVQREWKRQQVVDCLTRIGGMENPNVKPTFGTDETYHYRSKLTPHYDMPFKGRIRGIGFQKCVAGKGPLAISELSRVYKFGNGSTLFYLFLFFFGTNDASDFYCSHRRPVSPHLTAWFIGSRRFESSPSSP